LKLIVCLDERKGMMFNNRRQSRDRVLIDNMIKMVGDDKLYIAPYSESLFENKEIKLKVKKNPLKAADENWCFIENLPVAEYKDEIETVVIYHWNRHYPGDFFFDLELDSYSLESSEELVGSSHEKITKEIWKK
jgi:hypothetical protein